MKISLYVQPSAKKTAVDGYRENVLKIKLAAPAVDGRANAELIEFVSRAVGVPKSEISITSGISSRFKTVELECGLNAREIEKLLTEGGLDRRRRKR